MVITRTAGYTEEVSIFDLYTPQESPDAWWTEFLNDFIRLEWQSGLQALPERPVAYLEGERDGVAPTRSYMLFLPVVLRGSD